MVLSIGMLFSQLFYIPKHDNDNFKIQVGKDMCMINVNHKHCNPVQNLIDKKIVIKTVKTQVR
jgi:hypothetical protein